MTFAPAPVIAIPALRHVNLELEQAVLGAILVNNDAFDNVGLLEPRHFYEPVHQQIFRIAADFIGSGKPATPVAIKPFFQADIIIGGLTAPQYLVRLTAEATTAINVADYARTLIDMAVARGFIAAAAELATSMADADRALKRAFDTADELRLETLDREGRMRPIGAAAKEALERIGALYQGVTADPALPVGLTDLDGYRLFQPGQFIVVGARPSMGKTILAGNLAHNAARLKAGTAIFTLEMPEGHLLERIISEALFDRHKLNSSKLSTGNITSNEFEMIGDAVRDLGTLPLLIDDAPIATIGTLRAKIRHANKVFARTGRRLDLVIIDYLAFIKAGDRYRGQRTYEVGEISAALKEIARETGTTIVLLCQLNREVERRENRRPELADLRESGNLEQDADGVLLLYRKAYYLKDDPERLTDAAKLQEYDACRNTLEIIIAKNRRGPTGTVNAYIDLEACAIRDLDQRHAQSPLPLPPAPPPLVVVPGGRRS